MWRCLPLRSDTPIVSRIIALTPLIKGSSIPSRYLRTSFPSILGCKCSVLPLSAIGRRRSFRRKAFASSVFLNPPGVCLWSPHQMTRHLCGVRAIAEASSRLPYCCPSSLRATSASSIHVATGLYGCWHSWWKPPPHPIITCLLLRTSLRKAGRCPSQSCWQVLFAVQHSRLIYQPGT